MFDLLPEEMSGRSFPYVTLAIIALSTFFFLAFHKQLNVELGQLPDLESRNLRLAAAYPETPVTPAQQVLVEAFRRHNPDEWEDLAAPDRRPADSWESQLRDERPEEIERESATLGRQLEELRGSAVARYAFYPVHRAPWSYFTANFVHASWAALIINMLFLWLAGTVLEDVWGRSIYAGFYFVVCVGTVWVHSLYLSSPFMGASGATAALMAALLVRFPKTKVRRGTVRWSARPKILRFKSPVYAVLPIWLLGQVVWVRLAGQSTAVEYITQGGAFAIGAVLALLLRVTTVDEHIDRAIDTKAGGWTADPHIVKAGELLEKGLFDDAIVELKDQIAEKPSSAEAYEMLPGICQRQGDTIGYLAALEAVCQVHIEQHKFEAAWQDYEDYCAARGERMPAATWLKLCQIAEGESDLERAASEYEALARTWPEDRASVVALISAARMSLRLGRLNDAHELYKAAQKSPVPHQDWDESIRKGLERTDARTKAKSETSSSNRGPSKS